MSEERLKEIKHNIDFQCNIAIARHECHYFIDEELELYNEVIRLRTQNELYKTSLDESQEVVIYYRTIIDKALEYMNYTFDIRDVKDMFNIMNKLEDILNGKEK